MTHLSAGLRFVGTHLSIETSVSVPPSSPTHHWCMVSPGKETVDFTRLQVRSPPAPVGQSGCSGAGGGEGRFLGGALSSALLCLAPPAPPPLTTLPTPAACSAAAALVFGWKAAEPLLLLCLLPFNQRVVSSPLLTESRLGRPPPFPGEQMVSH